MSHQQRDRGRGVRGSGGDTRGGRWNTRGGAGGGSGGEGGSGGGGTSRGHGRGGAAGDSRGESRGRIGRGSGGRGSPAVSEGRGGGSGFSGGFGRGTRGDSDRGRARAFRGGRGAPFGPIIFAADSPAIVDARLSDADQDGVVRMFRNLEVTDKLPLRPGYGTLGKAVILRANFFPLNIPQNTLYDYQVDISPTVKKEEKQKRSRIFELIESSPLCTPFGDHIAHDRSERLVSSKELPQPLELHVVYQEAGQAFGYDISMVMKQKLDPRELTQYLAGSPQSCAYNPLPLTSALNLVLQMSPSRNGVRVGQNRFFFRNEIRNLALGVDAWKGFYSSVRPTYNQLMVNVNVCMAPFYVPGNLGDALVAFKTRSSGGMLSLPEHFARHLKMTTSYLGYKRRKPLTQIMDTSARRQTFFCEEMGRTVSVEEYFKHKYNITLEHADDLPVVNTGAYQNPSDQKRSGKKGRQGQANYIPAELCVIDSGLPYAELNEKETAAMIKIACNPPIINAKAIIDQGFPSLGISPGALASPLPGFGIEISAEMTVIPARELPPPRLTYRSGRPNVSGGSWNILNVEFHRGAVIGSWWVMVIQDPDPFGDPELEQLVDGFRNKCVASGMTFPDGRPRPIVVSLQPSSKQDQSRSAAIDQIRQELKRNLEETTSKPNLILVLLSTRDKHIYPGIKRLGDVELGLQTVHMLLPNALKGNDKRRDQYFSNVALKVNTKLNGINHMLDPESMRWLTTKKTIIVGMDVTHPGPRSKEGSPSIAAVVASVDDDFVQFPASLRIQKSKDEMVGGLAEMMAERLSLYKEHNGSQLPERVLFYRDGVSEGQFEKVLKDELPLIYKSFEKFDEPGRTYRPKLTIIVCGKRHHARFYPTTEANADLNGNTRPGTVVDKGITSVFNFDFYLQAHAGLQGTVRPTHYTVIYDENRLGADEVQQGTNTISYLYARATKAVSLVPAAYYADLACERGRFYINNILNLEEKSSSGAAVTQKQGKAEKDAEKARVFKDAEAMWGEGVHKDLRKTMFYI